MPELATIRRVNDAHAELDLELADGRHVYVYADSDEGWRVSVYPVDFDLEFDEPATGRGPTLSRALSAAGAPAGAELLRELLDQAIGRCHA